MRAALLVGGVVQTAAWLWYAAVVWRDTGLFSRIGLDFGFFWATARAYLLEGPRALFDQQAIARAAEPLVAYYATPTSTPLNVAPPVYPPLFFALLTPLTGLPPLVGLTLWTGASVLAAAAAVWGACRMTQPAGQLDRVRGSTFKVQSGGTCTFRTGFGLGWGPFFSALSFAPLALGLVLGQAEGLLLYALYRTYRALVARRELAAGLWLGALFLKPQYAVFLALVLLAKRRWRAVAWLAAAGAAVAALSLASIGGDVRSYWTALAQAAAFRPPPEAAAHAPGDMVSWRGLLYTLLPGATPVQGTVLTLALTAATVATLPLVWRGGWRPQDRAFPRRVLATMLVTMLASFHNHLHGAALLLVPALAAARAGVGLPLGAILVAALYLPSLLYLGSGDVALTAQATGALTVAALAIIVAQEVRDAWRTTGPEMMHPPAAPAVPGAPEEEGRRPVVAHADRDGARHVQSAAI